MPRDPGPRSTNLFARLTSDAEGQQDRVAPEEMERDLSVFVGRPRGPSSGSPSARAGRVRKVACDENRVTGNGLMWSVYYTHTLQTNSVVSQTAGRRARGLGFAFAVGPDCHQVTRFLRQVMGTSTRMSRR